MKKDVKYRYLDDVYLQLIFGPLLVFSLFLVLLLYSGGEVGEGIWNQTHLFSDIEFLPREITPHHHISR